MKWMNEIFDRINRLKQEKDVVILAHYYMPPELQTLVKDGGVADFIGDSLALSIEATRVKAKNILFCGVMFMAETAKVLNPAKNVYIPSKEAGCSLASSITPGDVRDLRKQYPGVPVIAYVNTFADTKAECDICCTSRNALQIARSFESDTLIFVPDLYMGQNLQQQIERETGKRLILWNGTCEVHEQFSRTAIADVQAEFPDAEMLLHWEVPKETVNASLHQGRGVLGSTGDILQYVKSSRARQFILASECDLGSVLKSANPDKEFITPCVKCPYMKKIDLAGTLSALNAIGTSSEDIYSVDIAPEILQKAAVPIRRMLEFV